MRHYKSKRIDATLYCDMLCKECNNNQEAKVRCWEERFRNNPRCEACKEEGVLCEMDKKERLNFYGDQNTLL